MKSIPIANASRRIGAPANWDHSTDGLCHTIEVVDTDDGFMVSAWLPTPDELKRLNEGKPVLLSISGRFHPVVSVDVHTEGVIELKR